MEVIDINLDNLEPVSLSFDDPKESYGNEPPSVNFGPGVELLINDKKVSSNSSTKVDMEDLDNLENELNNLSQSVDNSGVILESSNKSLGGLGGF